ncbi:UNVERIFIED_CONTAM: hypothetical protein Sradi_3741600 [Sesamum radiatum]|uniref:RNase H type-1 domain-containing protein n=1 Tax=Sesamum radiatum TaxID=300843 RepID=A0AAW2PYX4_SESRA
MLFSFKQKQEFKRASSVSTVQVKAPTTPTHWSPPSLGEVKLNFDGAVFPSLDVVGLGVVARDSTGECVWWKTVCKQGLVEPEMVEAFAAREAILLALRLGWPRVILEGDCANLHLKLVSRLPDCSALGPIIRDIKYLVSSFVACSFSLIRRSGNKVAHCLARRASISGSEGSCIPPDLSELLLSDCGY